MQIPHISLNRQNSILKPQKISSDNISKKINFQGENKDTFINSSKSFSNEDAIELIRTVLQESMGPDEAEEQINNFIRICKYLGIEPRNLPINQEYQGNLTNDQRTQVIFLTDPRNIKITQGLL